MIFVTCKSIQVVYVLLFAVEWTVIKDLSENLKHTPSITLDNQILYATFGKKFTIG